MTFFIDLTDLILFVFIVGFIAFIFYSEGKKRGFEDGLKTSHDITKVVTKIIIGVIKRRDQFLFSHTLLKKVNAFSVEIPEGFFDG